MTHDHLCPLDNVDGCLCWLIAKARADEREQAAQRVAALTPQVATWPEPMSVIAKLSAAVGSTSYEGLQEHCYECAGEQESYALAVTHAIAAARGEAQ